MNECNTYKIFDFENPVGRYSLKDLGIPGRRILKWNFEV
jgi:hypothetical protein